MVKGRSGKRKKRFNFGSDLDHYLDLLDPCNIILKTNSSKSHWWILMKFSGNVLNGTSNK